MTTLTVLHPGAMGAAVAAEASRSGRQVLWVPAHRSPATHERARKAGLTACPSLQEALDASEVVLSLCPPHAAEDVAVSVAGHGFGGLYVEANAISPQRMERFANEVQPGSSAVDGAIIGPPPGDRHTCRLYLAGDAPSVDLLRAVFEGSRVQVEAAGNQVGAASVLKMSFAGFQKVARTLAAVSHALADSHGVAHLLTETVRTPADRTCQRRTATTREESQDARGPRVHGRGQNGRAEEAHDDRHHDALVGNLDCAADSVTVQIIEAKWSEKMKGGRTFEDRRAGTTPYEHGQVQSGGRTGGAPQGLAGLSDRS